MSNLIPFKAKASGYFVKVPEETVALDVNDAGTKIFCNDLSFEIATIEVPANKYEFLGFTSDLSEADWGRVVECEDESGGVSFFDYCGVYCIGFPTAKDSGLSLMDSVGAYEKNPYGGQPAKHTPLSAEDNGMNSFLEKRWQQAQERTGKFALVLAADEK